MLIYKKFICRQDLKDNPNKLYVFGDNSERVGFGGQAKEMRGEPNAVGITTKKSPSMDDSAFFTNDDILQWIYENRLSVKRLVVHRSDIVWPSDGIGTGLAQLKERAHSIWFTLTYFEEYLEELQKEREVCVCGAYMKDHNDVWAGHMPVSLADHRKDIDTSKWM